jgi:hypothetical protein
MTLSLYNISPPITFVSSYQQVPDSISSNVHLVFIHIPSQSFDKSSLFLHNLARDCPFNRLFSVPSHNYVFSQFHFTIFE